MKTKIIKGILCLLKLSFFTFLLGVLLFVMVIYSGTVKGALISLVLSIWAGYKIVKGFVNSNKTKHHGKIS